MPNDIAKDLIRLAADMARATGLPSEFGGDHLPYRPRIYWLNCLSRAVDTVRGHALRVRAGADEIESLRSRLAEYEKLLAQAGEAFTKGTKRLADLEAERALIIQRAENAEAALAYAVSTGDECAIEVEALRKDAERYRWLRGSTKRVVQTHIEACVRRERLQCSDQNAIDAAIDAAMEQSHE